MAIDLTVNGVRHSLEVAPETPLLWVIRDQLGLTGTKFSCGIAQCGACTLHIDGRPVRSCSVPVSAVAGKTVTTIEGLSADGTHPVQLAWIELDVPQCGYCQSGMIMSVVALLERHPDPTDAEIDAEVTNACRCSTYHRIRQAIRLAASRAPGAREGAVMSNNDLRASASKPGLSRRDLLSTAAAATGALVVGFWMPQRAAGQIINPEGAAWATEPDVKEINAWVVVAPDDHVTIRIAQTELGQGVWTSNAMMVAEELQCDWSKVSPQYASVNRDGREDAPAWTLEVMGKGATDPLWRRRARVRAARPHRHRGHPEQPLSAHAHQCRGVRQGRPLLSSACRRGGARAPVAGGRQILGRPGRGAELRQQRDHPPPDRAHDHVWRNGSACRADAASRSGADPHQAALGMDPDGHRAEESRCPAESHRQDRLRHRCPPARHEMGGRQGLPGLWRHGEELRFRADSRPARRHLGGRDPDPRSVLDPRPRFQRRRRGHRRDLVPGQDGARQDADRVGRAARACCAQYGQHARGADRGAGPARPRACRTSETATASSRAAAGSSKRPTPRPISRVPGWSPATRRCSSPTTGSISGSATRARRRRAIRLPGSPAFRKQNVYLHLCHLGGGFGRNGNGPQAEQAIYIANQNRGTPIHLLWTREEDFVGTTYRSMGVARLRAALDARRLADRHRGADRHGREGPRRDRRVRQGAALLRAELPLLDP